MRSATHRFATFTLAAIAMLCGYAGSAGAEGVITSLPAGPQIVDLAEVPGGGVELLTRTWSERTSGTRVDRWAVSPAGALGKPRRFGKRDFDFTGSFLPGGTDVLLTRDGTIDRDDRRLPDVQTIVAGVPGKAVSIAGPTRSRNTLPAPPLVGPTGSMLSVHTRLASRRSRLGFYFRAGGAAGFGPFTELWSAPRSSRVVDTGVDAYRTIFAFDASGGGAALSVPADGKPGRPWVQRITPTGAPGPRIDLGISTREAAGGALGFGPTGVLTVVIAEAAMEFGPGQGSTQAVTLAPGAAAVSAPQRLGDADAVTANSDLFALAVAPTGRISVVNGIHHADEQGQDLQLFEGEPGALAPVATLPPGPPARNVRVFPRDDGGTTVAWEHLEDDLPSSGLYVTTRPPGGTFSPPRQVTERLPAREFTGRNVLKGHGFRGAGLVRALSGGRLAVTYALHRRTGVRDRLLVVRP